MSGNVSLALSQIYRIESLCNFPDHPAIKAAVDLGVPMSMPNDIGSLGFDTPFLAGLGIVGLWSALDAFTERTLKRPRACQVCKSRLCVWHCLWDTGKLDAINGRALAEIEDVRHLFAHNYAGHADTVYFDKKPRHVLKSGVSVPLACGATFDGTNLSLNMGHLRFYVEQSRAIIEKVA
jgi:hypothetical protein